MMRPRVEGHRKRRPRRAARRNPYSCAVAGSKYGNRARHWPLPGEAC